MLVYVIIEAGLTIAGLVTGDPGWFIAVGIFELTATLSRR